MLRSARAADRARTLVAIHLTEGNDTPNTVIPWSNPAYHRIRGALSIPAADALLLDERNALHPALPNLQALWNRRRLSIVHGVGYPAFDYSHFQAMEIYWSADPRRTTVTGWMGRAIDAAVAAEASPVPLTAALVGSGLPPSLTAQRFAQPALPADPRSFSLPARDDRLAAAVRKVLRQPLTGTNLVYDGMLRGSLAAVESLATISSKGVLQTAIRYPGTRFAASLAFAAQLLRADDSIRVITLEQGAYDTHENQLTGHAGSLAELDAGLGASTADLDVHGLSDRVLILLWSEFARRVPPNASCGTDRGSAHAMLLNGTGVRAGVVGEAPSLADADLVDAGNLPMQHDFRNLYAALLSGWLEIDPARVLAGAKFTPLPVLQ